MPQQPDAPAESSRDFHEAMRNAPRLTAVVRDLAHGVVVELSDGRQCCLTHEVSPVRSVSIAAAVEWAKRHGAMDVKVHA